MGIRRAGSEEHGGRILFLVTEDWYFVSHRLALAERACKQGFDVVVATRCGEYAGQITRTGARLIKVDFDRQGMNLFSDLRLLLRLIQLYRKERPDLVHHIALKPVIYGSLAARFARVPSVVNALAGLGYIFASANRKARVLRVVVKRIMRMVLNMRHSVVIVQNPDDARLMCEQFAIPPDHVVQIRGAGVDLEYYHPTDEPEGKVVVLLPARMLWDKGVGEFVDAARILRKQGIEARFVLAGDSDPGNPSSIDRQQLDAWVEEGVVEWWGHCEDMPSTFARSHAVCLPSYREGLPKVLAEAAACGRPVVTTDVPGCREVVVDGDNGLLVPARDAVSLASALRKLVTDRSLRTRMGLRGRERVKESMSLETVTDATFDVYRTLMQR